MVAAVAAFAFRFSSGSLALGERLGSLLALRGCRRRRGGGGGGGFRGEVVGRRLLLLLLLVVLLDGLGSGNLLDVLNAVVVLVAGLARASLERGEARAGEAQGPEDAGDASAAA